MTQGTVEVWFVREGDRPTVGDPSYRLSLEICVEKLGLQKHQWFLGLDERLRFASADPKLAEIAGNRHVICRIRNTSTAAGWKPGLYLLELSPIEVAERLK